MKLPYALVNALALACLLLDGLSPPAFAPAAHADKGEGRTGACA